LAPIFEIRSLTHAYDGKTVLGIEHLSIPSASIIGLVGPNGSGKSTLLRLMGLIEKPSRGDILFNGQRVEPFSNLARFQISILPQEPILLKRGVSKNIAYGLKLRGDTANLTERINRALDLVGLDGADFARRPWYALSGGEAQRVALAARLALNPRVLLMDEPTASVDAASALRIKEAALRARQELGTTLVVASHDWQWLYEVCDDILHLFKGRIFGSGRETLVFGPWTQIDSAHWGKKLPDDQILHVPRPPQSEATAVIEQYEVIDADSRSADGDAILQATVSRLSLERKKGQVFATVIAGELAFTIGLTPPQADGRTIYPGQRVGIRYRPDKIKWI
jgi:tungstate transport system ATP-binding protein